MKFVGIDPSTKTGLVILGEDGTVLVEKEIVSKVKNDPQRFVDLAEQIIESITKCCEPDEIKVAIEGFSYGSKGKAVSTQYGIGWTIRILLLENLLRYIEVPPAQLKKFATGKGNVSKDALVLPIYKRWGYENNSDNVRDAFVLAQIVKALYTKEEVPKFQKESLEKVGGE